MDLPDVLYHPLFQSLVLPLMLAVAGIGLFRLTAGRDRAAAAVGLAVIVSVIWMAGWATRPGSTMQKLPWILACAWLLGVVLNLAVGSRLLQWLVLTAGWLAASWWLGSTSPAQGIALALGGAAVVAGLLRASEERADGAAVGVLASLGLAGLAFQAGSLALFQLALILAAACGGAVLWLWPKPRIRFGAAGAAVASIGWLALAQATLLLVPAQPLALAVLTLAFAAAVFTSPLARRLSPGSRPVLAPLMAAAIAGACVVAALALQAGGAPGATGSDRGKGDPYDPYYSN